MQANELAVSRHREILFHVVGGLRDSQPIGSQRVLGSVRRRAAMRDRGLPEPLLGVWMEHCHDDPCQRNAEGQESVHALTISAGSNVLVTQEPCDTPISHDGGGDVAAARYRRCMGLHIRTHRTLCACAFLIVAWTSPGRADLVTPRVRPLGSRVVSLLQRGYAVSPTPAILVDALERTNVIVHIEERWLFDGGPGGETQFVTTAGGQRYLRIHLDPSIHDEAAIALLGHELQHALEIAEARWVVDHETLVRLYTCIGYESRGRPHTRGVDTARANETGRHVLTELRAFGARRSSSTD